MKKTYFAPCTQMVVLEMDANVLTITSMAVNTESTDEIESNEILSRHERNYSVWDDEEIREEEF